MNRRTQYKNQERWKETTKRQKDKYYKPSQKAKNHRQFWTEDEIKMVMEQKKPDRELADLLGRSVHAIQACRRRRRRTEKKIATTSN